ncbi:hypothetical protein CKA32_004253 [Geitlerinema sp. FC II]|nr:hypothetical protein CKA32_004253 [Geitlerinema sp. FC II]
MWRRLLETELIAKGWSIAPDLSSHAPERSNETSDAFPVKRDRPSNVVK